MNIELKSDEFDFLGAMLIEYASLMRKRWAAAPRDSEAHNKYMLCMAIVERLDLSIIGAPKESEKKVSVKALVERVQTTPALLSRPKVVPSGSLMKPRGRPPGSKNKVKKKVREAFQLPLNPEATHEWYANN